MNNHAGPLDGISMYILLKGFDLIVRSHDLQTLRICTRLGIGSHTRIQSTSSTGSILQMDGSICSSAASKASRGVSGRRIVPGDESFDMECEVDSSLKLSSRLSVAVFPMNMNMRACKNAH